MAIRSGVIGGILGGLAMAAWAMVLLGLTGSGWLTPLNLIAHTWWRDAPLDGAVSLPAILIGLVTHVLVAMFFGILIATLAFRFTRARSLVIAAGTLMASGIWIVMQFGIWHAIDPVAAAGFTPWIMATAHLLFGMMAAFGAGIVVRDEEARAAVHPAAPPLQPGLWDGPGYRARPDYRDRPGPPVPVYPPDPAYAPAPGHPPRPARRARYWPRPRYQPRHARRRWS
ncbi:hypothetical protein [Streptomyces boninensis]|uniref:hypothetical protein n=1 Tax=Streptomyces boninensis TaxID=2039455 RepID=UPI003B228702